MKKLLHMLACLLNPADPSDKPEATPEPAPVVADSPLPATQTKRELEAALRAQGLSRTKAKREVSRRHRQARPGSRA